MSATKSRAKAHDLFWTKSFTAAGILSFSRCGTGKTSIFESVQVMDRYEFVLNSFQIGGLVRTCHRPIDQLTISADRLTISLLLLILTQAIHAFLTPICFRELFGAI